MPVAGVKVAELLEKNGSLKATSREMTSHQYFYFSKSVLTMIS